MNSIEIPASTTSVNGTPCQHNVNINTKPPPATVATSTTPGRRSRRRNKASESLSKDFYEIYELEDPIGQGSCAVVKKAKHRKTGKCYAVKCVQTPNSPVEYRRVREKCLNEMMVLRACEDSNKIIQLHDFKEDSQHFFMVFELVEGGNLQELLDDRDGGKLSVNEAACVIKDLAEGLKFLHAKGIVHRDMKPDNILCCSDEFASPCKIIDFDLAKAHEADNSAIRSPGANNTYSGASYNQKSNLDSGIDHSYPPDLGMSPVSGNWRDRSESPSNGMYRPDQRYLPMTSPVGSPEYMPPEIVEKCLDDYYNMDEYNQSCDIWSLGIIAYMTISGRPPFVAQTAECSFKECEWNYGGQCPDCQESLWEQILHAELEFPAELGWNLVPQDAKDLIRCCLDRRINNRISAGEILEHPFIENFALSEAEIALKPIIEVEEPIEEVKQDEAIEVVEEFERMKLPTEILEGNDDTGYHPFDYPSENEMAYSPPRSKPIPIRAMPTNINHVIAQPRIQVSINTQNQVPSIPPIEQIPKLYKLHHGPSPVQPDAYQPTSYEIYHQPPIGHAIGPRGIPMPVPTNNNISPFYRSNSQFF